MRIQRQMQWLPCLVITCLVGALLGGCSKAPEPTEFFARISQGLLEDDPEQFWDALPNDYKRDLAELLNQFAEKVDPEIYNQVMQCAGQVGSVFLTKADIIAGGLKEMPSLTAFQDSANTQKLLTGIGEVLQEFADSPVAKIEGLKDLDLDQLFEGPLTRLTSNFGTIADALAAGPDVDLAQSQHMLFRLLSGKFEYELTSNSEERVQVKVTRPETGESRFYTLKLVDNKWLPEDFVADWKRFKIVAHARIDAMAQLGAADKKHLLGLVEETSRSAQQIGYCQSAEDFRGMLPGLLPTVVALIRY